MIISNVLAELFWSEPEIRRKFGSIQISYFRISNYRIRSCIRRFVRSPAKIRKSEIRQNPIIVFSHFELSDYRKPPNPAKFVPHCKRLNASEQVRIGPNAFRNLEKLRQTIKNLIFFVILFAKFRENFEKSSRETADIPPKLGSCDIVRLRGRPVLLMSC